MRVLSENRHSAIFNALKKTIDSHYNFCRETVISDILSMILTINILPNIVVQILSVVRHSAEIRLLQKQNSDSHSDVCSETES